MCAPFTVLRHTPIAAAIAGWAIPLSRNNTIWMRWRCAAGIFQRNAVFSRRTSALLHLTICFPRIRWRKRITPRARKIAPDYRPRIPIQAVMEATANAINPTLYDNLNFNFIRDIAPVAGIMRVPSAMVVHPSVPAKTVPEFIAYAKANPSKINMGSAGNGSTPHVFGELFKMMAGVSMVHVPYRGIAPALTDLMA